MGKQHRFLRAGALAVFVLLPIGCSGGIKGERVEGKVTFEDGKPLSVGSVVTFHPDSAQGNTSPHTARGSIDSSGNYKLSPDVAGISGVPRGWYKVSVGATKSVNPKDEYSEQVSIIPKKYDDPGTSGIKLQVVANPAPGAYDIKIKR